MSSTVRIALDVMGGDHGPDVVLPGAEIALTRHPDISFLLFGDEVRLNAVLARLPRLKAASRVIHTDVVVRMDDKPSQALRQGRKVSSMWRAIDAVRLGEADCAVSAGNTGALMAMAKVNLKTMAGISRPAIACLWPTNKGESVVLDVGASIGATAQHLVDMAVMGAAMARIVFDIERPTVGLLNIGVEEIKGVEEVKDAAAALREANHVGFAYHGFVEGDDIGKGTVDVVVTEGFSGNIALKTAEGTAKQVADYLRAAINRSLMAKIGYVLARSAFNALREKLDPRKSNGGVFLGLNGIVIKSHGGTDAEGFASAVDIGYDMVRNKLLSRIEAGMNDRPKVGAAAPESAAQDDIQVSS
ncbi:phosphate acyltransferase PlsX [Ancylobacter sp. SL191]|jgi:glycerol-3-phosphate acyltransferase PlsX|uniref:phosphate acyltransferase PlsX n=1 Tax=Ancylobacter sp. SL191 TaxID=2995166 RepID=UPI00226EE90C|nr:phosphate acyltransferase PlsX [Ancylobacter sp. SL191]WAC26457.1 phosphate acyltransferase PlsX [Ancylobacter sp. SL191]